ncbi:MAG: DUF2089 domain-containing protein [Bacilli bacterium]|nr:DUF2089 domain-containing protein [Bacilli bacterium]
MENILKKPCPVCGCEMNLERKYVCSSCGTQIPVKENQGDKPSLIFDELTAEQMHFLMVFLQCEGNIKRAEDQLGISYPTFKRRYDDLMVALKLKSYINNDFYEEVPLIEDFEIQEDSLLPSDIIKNKLKKEGGRTSISLLDGKQCFFKFVTPNLFVSDKLGSKQLNFAIFDIIVDFLKQNGGSAKKGSGRNKEDKVGYGKCTPDTVLYAVATEYFGHPDGEPTFDPIFVLAAILQWADIAYNERGYIELKENL